jgi:hypothetical protein
MTTNEKLDKDRFRRDLGGEAEAYQEVARRLGLLPEGEANMVLDLDKHRCRCYSPTPSARPRHQRHGAVARRYVIGCSGGGRRRRASVG